jgi:uncharacterized protein (DUF433 family)
MAKTAVRIVTNPEILGGKPTVAGTRIAVETVIAHLASQLDLDELYAAYPALTPEDVKACLSYANDELRLLNRKKRADQRSKTASQAR